MNENPTNIGELIEPAPIGFSLDAPGWYVVSALLILFLAGIIIWTWIIHFRNRYRRDALRHILILENDIRDKSLLAYEVNMIMKRIALRFRPRGDVAALRNEQWVEFLNNTGKPNLFSKNLSHDLFLAIHSGTVTREQADNFLLKAKAWIKVHKYSKKESGNNT